ncbi:MAG: PASTA domain-containing protein [Solirubrobacteraceae bacterium]
MKASKSVHRGVVISTSPGAGVVPAGTAVTIVVSSGPPPKKHHKKH